MFNAKGIDVSHWQKEISWQAVKDAGISFAFAKATEANSFVDPQFDRNWQAMRDAGVLRGAYHFFRPTVDAAEQARHFADVQGQLKEDDLPPALDLETRDGVSKQDLIQGARTWLLEVEERLERRPLIYSAPFFWEQHLVENGVAPDWTAEYSLWIANYEVFRPVIPTGFHTWTFWQFTDKGAIGGIDGNVDVNWFNGTHDNLRAFLGVDLLPERRIHHVEAGETLTSIAEDYDIALQALIAANPKMVQEGTELNIPILSATAPKEKPRSEELYVVQPGDNLTLIATRLGTTVDLLIKINKIADPDRIEVGQVLKIVPQ